jgi:hypothetical protein
MNALGISTAVAIFIFAAGIVGLYLQRLLPDHHTTELSREMIKAVTGLVSLLLALVLGTLVSSSYSLFSNQKAELESLASRFIQLDMALDQYGPEAKPGRAIVADALSHGYQLFWGDRVADPVSTTAAAALPGLKAMNGYLNSLEPRTPAQQDQLSRAKDHFGAVEKTRLEMSLQLVMPVSGPLLIIIATWSLLLFCGYGLLSRISAMTLAALAFGAFSVGSAIFLIIEMRQPYTGLLRIPPTALVQAIEAVNR